jgi:hypothetical protein
MRLLVFSTAFFFTFLFLHPSKLEDEYAYQKPRNESRKDLRQLLLIGTGMIFMAYPTAITLSVYEVNGRASRVHFAASIGAALITGCLWILFLHVVPNQKIWKNIVIFFLSLHLSLLALFCIQVQSFYKLSWDYQKAFWTDVLSLAPDIENNTVILVDAPSLQRYGKQINPFDWSLPSVLSSIYKFPRAWQNYPRLYLLNSFDEGFDFWPDLIDENGKFLLSGKTNSLIYYYAWEAERIVEPHDVILISEENNRLIRYKNLEIEDISISLKSKPKSDYALPQTPHSILFEELISDPPQLLEKDAIPIYFQPQV